MKILIYASQPGHSTNRLLSEIEKRAKKQPELNLSGEVEYVYDLYAYCSEVKGHDRVYRRAPKKSEKLVSREYGAVIPRLAGVGFDYGVGVVRHLTRNLNIFSTATDTGLRVCSNKFLTCQVLSEFGLRVPKQVLSHQPSDYKELIDLVGGLPAVAKLQRGSQGAGVFILETVLAASTALRALEMTKTDVVLTRFIDSGKPANDLRIIVIGAETENPVTFAYRRFAVDSDFRSNYSISGKGEKCDITEEEKAMAITASRVLGGGCHGVDIMRDSKNGDLPYLIEVNGCPGLAGVEAVTGENVAGAILDYVLTNYKRGGFRKLTTEGGATSQAVETVRNILPASSAGLTGNQVKENFAQMVSRLRSDYL